MGSIHFWRSISNFLDLCFCKKFPLFSYLQVNLCQKHLFLHQLTQNMTKDCSLIYQVLHEKIQAQNMLFTYIVFLFWHSEQFMYTTSSVLVIFIYWTCKSMKNLLSYFGLVDARIRASNKDLPVCKKYSMVHTTTVGGHNLVKFGQRSWWMTQSG